jgi:hypothetical protein
MTFINYYACHIHPPLSLLMQINHQHLSPRLLLVGAKEPFSEFH